MHARALRACERDQGVGLEDLPWPTPRDAAAFLDGSARGRLAAFRRRVRDCWLDEDPATALANAFAVLDPRSVIALYPGAPTAGPSWFRQTVSTGTVLSTGIRGQEELPKVRLYPLRGRDRFGDRPVSITPLVRLKTVGPTDPLIFLDAVLAPNDIHKQLRMVLYDSAGVALFAGQYRSQRGAQFSVDDHALLLAARPALRAWTLIARAIGRAPLGDSDLGLALCAMREPALLVQRGRVIFTNAAGRPFVEATRCWLLRARPAGFADVTKLAPRGLPMELVLPTGQLVESPIAALPPFLRRIADQLVLGASDKDIAAALSMSLSTVRTYVTRIYKRLGVRSRREVMTMQCLPQRAS